MGIVECAVTWALAVAMNSEHGYSQFNRWSPDYDCSSFVISAYEQAGVKLKEAGATYTGNMYDACIWCGFKDVTSEIDLSTGKGLKPGDIILNTIYHVVMYVGDGKIVQASIAEDGTADRDGHCKTGDQTGNEIGVRNYYQPSYNWNYVLRYAKEEKEEKMDYSTFVKFMNQYNDDLAEKGVPSDPEHWTYKAHKFVTDNHISDGYRPFSKVTRVEVWAMLRAFYDNMIKEK